METENFDLFEDDFKIILESLKLFISEKQIDDVSPSVKFRNDILASSTLKKISEHEEHFSAEDLRIIVVALHHQKITLHDKLSRESKPAIRRQIEKVNTLLNFFVESGRAQGLPL
ncbi:MAG: hypothetical protein ACK5L3_08695 [Oscillospiraceae bacterium]